MSFGRLTKEDYSDILYSLEAGNPPNIRYLPLIYAGRKNLLNKLVSQIMNLIKQEKKVEFCFINGERGQGKTITSQTAIQIVNQQLTEKLLVPIYIDLAKVADPLNIFRYIFLRMLTGALGIIEYNDDIQDQLFRLMHTFIIDLNYHQLQPKRSAAPLTLLGEVGKILADQNAVVCIIIDELDYLSVQKFSPILAYCMEIFRTLNDITRLSKFWIFCSTQSGQVIFHEAKEQGNPFASRVYSAVERSPEYILKPLAEDEVIELVDKIINVFLETYDQKKDSLPSSLIFSLRRTARNFNFPREIIGNTTSLLFNYKDFEIFWDKSYEMRIESAFATPNEAGKTLDQILKSKILPSLEDIHEDLEFTSKPPESPSLWFEKNRKVDGRLKFNDGYKLFIEIKYSDTKSTLDKDYLDQIASHLKKHPNSEGIYILFGSFSLTDPVQTKDKDWLKNSEVWDKIKFFQVGEGIELEDIKRLIVKASTESFKASNNSLKRNPEIVACSKWILSVLGVEYYIKKLKLDHKGKVPKTVLDKYLHGIPPEKSFRATEPIKTSETTDQTVKTNRPVIKLKPGQ